MPGKMRECDGCHKIMRSDYLKIHMKKSCKELKKEVNEGDASGVDIQAKVSQKLADAVMKKTQSAEPKKHKADCLEESEDIPTTFEKSEFDGVESLSNENRARILKLEKRFYPNCQECGKTMLSCNIKRHRQKYCQALRSKKDNEGNASGVSEKDSQTSTETETTPKKRKADCLGESKNIPTTFKEPRFSGVKSLPNETLLRMLEITYENQTRILKLEERFHNKKRNPNISKFVADRLRQGMNSKKRYTQANILPTTKQAKIDGDHLIGGSGIFLD
jgi:hypothetical protein